jgi:hypothetical protein
MPPRPPPPPGTLPGAAVGIATAHCNYSSVGYLPNPTVWDVAPKQSYLAMRTLTGVLDGQQCSGRLALGNGTDKDFLLSFGRPGDEGEPSLVGWTRHNESRRVTWQATDEMLAPGGDVGAAVAEDLFEAAGTDASRDRTQPGAGVLSPCLIPTS